MLNEYNVSPTLCKYCSSSITYENRRQSFCSHSCRAKYQNPLRPKKVKIPYDSNAVLLERFSNGLVAERPTLRKAIALVKGYCCDICKLTNWNNSNITLIVDHIDGNAGNNKPDNLRLLCPNCNSQTPTFGGRNKGNGRKARGLPLR